MKQITQETYEQMKKLVEEYEKTDDSSTEQTPYFQEFTLNKEIKYNPNYGDDRTCKCGHVYYRHFDTYEEMYACGCKYCQCDGFVEATPAELEAINKAEEEKMAKFQNKENS